MLDTVGLKNADVCAVIVLDIGTTDKTVPLEVTTGFLYSRIVARAEDSSRP
ncbi:hypothetical protein CCP3SC1AL1_110004 [Gammaproteobacteria bacterium]